MPDQTPPTSLFADAATERVLTTFFENMPLLGVGLDTNGNITYVNPYFLTVTGYGKDEVVGKNWFTLFVPPPLQSTLSALFADLMAKDGDTRYENAVLAKSGETRQISWTNAVLQDANGKSTGTLSIGEDVTSLKRAEESLLESEERFRALAEAAREGVVIHDHGVILLCNQRLADMSGYTVAEMIGKNIMDFFPPESAEIVQKHMDEEKEGCYEVEAHKKDKTVTHIEICSRNTQYRGRRARVTTVRELGEAKR